MNKFIKSKASKNATGPGFRTSDHFKGSIFGGGKSKPNAPKVVFNPSAYRSTQHKGGS